MMAQAVMESVKRHAWDRWARKQRERGLDEFVQSELMIL